MALPCSRPCDRLQALSIMGTGKIMKNNWFFAFIGLASMLAASPTTAPAQPVDPFYAGKTINILVGAGEGGAYSSYGQLAAEYLRKLLPGNPTVVVQSMPGAGGIKATDYLANVAP